MFWSRAAKRAKQLVNVQEARNLAYSEWSECRRMVQSILTELAAVESRELPMDRPGARAALEDRLRAAKEALELARTDLGDADALERGIVDVLRWEREDRTQAITLIVAAVATLATLVQAIPVVEAWGRALGWWR